jgi:hypothetical protein
VLWTRYVQLTQIENVFRSLKSELGIRPIYHQLEHRADAHVFIAFLAYCLQVTLKNRLMIHAPGLTPASVFEKLSTIQMVEVWIPMLDGRWLVLPRHTQPEADVQALLEQIRMTLPAQPPPRIKSSQLPTAATNQPVLSVSGGGRWGHFGGPVGARPLIPGGGEWRGCRPEPSQRVEALVMSFLRHRQIYQSDMSLD